ncbi:MAG: Hpt domain-containing protein [Deltaproteobacteria bacterium]|nr:Hpt domain-containing protein [Deltaproteobacteria bacterium]
MSARDPELTRLLVQELERHLSALEVEAARGEVEKAAADEPASLEPIRRAVHALKGSAGLAGEPELASAMQRLERRLRDGEATALGDVLATVRGAIVRLKAGEVAIAAHWPEPPPDMVPRVLEPLLRSQYVAEVTDRLEQIDVALDGALDPIDAVAQVFRHVHTVKGAASAASDDPMAWFCHGLEERLRDATKSRESAIAALEEVGRHRNVLGGLLDDPEAALATLRGLPLRSRGHAQRGSTRPGAPDDEARVGDDATIRVSAQAVDRLLDHMGGIAVARERVAARVVRASAQSQSLRRLRADLAEALRLIGPPRPWGAPAAALRRVERTAQRLAEIGEELDRAAELLGESDQALKDNAGSAKKLLSAMRQTPIRGMFARLSAAALAEARRTDRLLAVRTVGGDEPIDRRLAELLTEPCLQLTRNAIAHGIELPAVREAAGKPREATITFTARRTANRLVVTIADDGQGVDVSAVRARAVEAGLVTDVLAEAADDQTLLELLFLPGFSMRGHSPDLLAGRGIGLDITLASVQKLGGSIRLSSRHRWGLEARVDVPIESGLARVLWVTAGGAEHAVPALHTQRIRVNDGPEAERIPHLAACLEPGVVQPRPPFVLDLDVGIGVEERLTIGIDAVGATEEVLVRELSPSLRRMGPFAGAIVRGDGTVRLALDVHALAPRARALGRVPEGRVSEIPSRPPPPFA